MLGLTISTQIMLSTGATFFIEAKLPTESKENDKESIMFNYDSEDLGDNRLVSVVKECMEKSKPKAPIKLSLNDNNISNEGIAKLADFAKDNHVTIETLRVGGNNIDDKAVKSFVEMAKHSGLRELDLPDNQLTAKGFIELIKSPLSALSVAFNKIQIDGSVVEAIKLNKTLVDLSVVGNIGSKDMEKSEEQLMKDIERHIISNVFLIYKKPIFEAIESNLESIALDVTDTVSRGVKKDEEEAMTGSQKLVKSMGSLSLGSDSPLINGSGGNDKGGLLPHVQEAGGLKTNDLSSVRRKLGFS